MDGRRELAALRARVVDRVIDGPGVASTRDRAAAFANADPPVAAGALLAKVVAHADQISDEDVAAAIAAGLSEDQVFELVVAAALGEAGRQYDAALAALAEVIATPPAPEQR